MRYGGAVMYRRAARFKQDLGLRLEISGEDACSDKKDSFPVPARLSSLKRHFKQVAHHFLSYSGNGFREGTTLRLFLRICTV